MERPKTIRALATSRDSTVDAVIVKCRFCRKNLSLYDKLNFEYCQLQVIYRNNRPYAACLSCVTLVSRIEYTVGLERVFPANATEGLYGQNLFDLDVRCIRCLRPLENHERALCYYYNYPIYVVRQRFRASCTLCMLF